jgi:aconitate hydratase
MNIDLATEPLGRDATAIRSICKDIWPSQAEIAELVEAT